MNKIAALEAGQLKKHIAKFSVGDTVRVYVKIVEEEKTRLQAFEGIVIRRRGRGMGETFTVRRISYGEGVERIFPLQAPVIDKIVVTKPGRVKRARLFYLRGRVGRQGRVQAGERPVEAETPEAAAPEPPSAPAPEPEPSKASSPPSKEETPSQKG